jgi:hypothetical protein
MSLLACQSKPSSEATMQPTDSTGAKKPQSVAVLEKTVLAVHDSVMPAMSELIKLKKDVIQHLNELDKQPDSVERQQQKQQGLAMKAALEKADQAMMDWMHHYNGDTLAILNREQAMAYLQEEQKRVNAMSQLMRNSIIDAQAYLISR